MFFTNGKGIGGRIKQRIEDFRVEEVAPKKLPLHDIVEGEKIGKHAVFWMEKFNWDTTGALMQLARTLRISFNDLKVAGTKDKRAITRQRVSVFGVNVKRLQNIRIKDIKLSEFSEGRKLKLGDLEGNKFEIVIRDVDLSEEEIKKRVESIFSELRQGIPNVFGPQRFGEIRPVTHLIGKELIKENLEEAAKIYLTKVFPAEPEDSQKARKFLADNWNASGFKKSFHTFPGRLKFEIILLEYLAGHPKDFKGAFLKLPKKLLKLFPNAVQSLIFNRTLKKFKGGDEIPVVGYNTQLGKDNLSGLIRKILREEDVCLSDFKMKAFRNVMCSGSLRKVKLVPKDLRLISIEEDKFNIGKKAVKVSFSLASGSYATIILREIMKNER